MHLIFKQYAERLERLRADESTLRNHQRTAVLFDKSGLDPLTCEDVDIEKWLVGLTREDGREMAARTKRLHLENLSAVYAYAVRRRLLPVSPMEGVRLPREPDKEPRVLETHELRELLRRCTTERQHLLLHILIYTGMRRNEVRTLEWENVSADTITVVNGKGGKLRHVPIHPALAEVLADTPRTTPAVFPGRDKVALSQTAMQGDLDAVRGEIDCCFHDFRRTVATSLVENDVPTNLVDSILGWAPRTVQGRYYVRTAGQRLQEAILKLYASDPL